MPPDEVQHEVTECPYMHSIERLNQMNESDSMISQKILYEKISQIVQILKPSSFNGFENDQRIDKSIFYDWDRLKSTLKISDDDMLAALSRNLIAHMDGRF